MFPDMCMDKSMVAGGLTEIDGKTYYFNGYMYINRRVIVDGTLYYLGQDGSVESQLKPSKDGWAKFGDDWYYVKNGEFVCDEFIEDGGYVYIISSDGTIWTTLVSGTIKFL